MHEQHDRRRNREGRSSVSVRGGKKSPPSSPDRLEGQAFQVRNQKSRGRRGALFLTCMTDRFPSFQSSSCGLCFSVRREPVPRYILYSTLQASSVDRIESPRFLSFLLSLSFCPPTLPFLPFFITYITLEYRPPPTVL